jgi:DNA-directed RNA polymerase subunit RPC12/RpoP
MTTYVCRHCGSPDIDAEERVPRFIAIAIDGIDEHGELDWHYDPTNRDEAEWEGSETIGFRCATCDEPGEQLADLVHAVPGTEESQ